MKIAIVHDQLQEFGGAERVLVALKQIYPQADVFTSFYTPSALGIHAEQMKDWTIYTSWADKVSFMKKLYSPLRFITPLIWESFNFNAYDLVISSSGSYMSKGIITRPDTAHICYLHHPPRYLYYYETAIEWQKYWPIKIYGHLINHRLRIWDYLSSQRVDHFIANSVETQKRVEKFYRREAKVIYPPVTIPEELEHGTWNLPAGRQSLEHKKYYLTVSRLARAKHIDVLIKAANKMKIKLKIVGTGRDETYLKSIAGPTVEFLGAVSDEKLPEIYNGAKAFLFASVDEEFGIAPIEAMGYGVPVIALASGGLKETVQEGKNGYLYQGLDEEKLIQKVTLFENTNAEIQMAIRQQARKSSEQYSFENFKRHITQYVEDIIK